jgi:uncharacterized membrane protein
MHAREWIEWLKDRQFVIPSVFIAIGVALAITTGSLDNHLSGAPLVIPSTVRAARTLLATVAGAIITVAALVFSFSAVAVQLAGTQYSPRVIQDFLRDRFQQSVVGMVMGTFAFSLVSLAELGSDEAETSRVDVTATVAVALGVASAVAIVTFIDHMTRRLRVDDTMQRLAKSTIQAFEHERSIAAVDDDTSWQLVPATDARAVRSGSTGFVQAVDIDEILHRVPPGAVVRLDIWPGDHVTKGNRVATIWVEEGEETDFDIDSSVAIGTTRTVGQDPAFGIGQLVDIALRALSRGINDPATASDVVRLLAGPVRAAHLAGMPRRVFTSENGSRLVTPHAPTPADHVRHAYTQIIAAALEHPAVLEAVTASVQRLIDELGERGIDVSALERIIEQTSDR